MQLINSCKFLLILKHHFAASLDWSPLTAAAQEHANGNFLALACTVCSNISRTILELQTGMTVAYSD